MRRNGPSTDEDLNRMGGHAVDESAVTIAAESDDPPSHWRHSRGVGGCAWGFVGQYMDGGFPERLRAIDEFLQANPEVRMVSWLTGDQTNDMVERRRIPDGSSR